MSINLGDEMHYSKRAQISHLKSDEALSKVPSKNADFADVSSPKLAARLLEHMGINNLTIKFVNNWQPQYGLIYSPGPVDLEILKVDIENNLADGFIKPSKFHAGALIFFDKKPDGSQRLYVDYRDLNNLTIKN